MRRREKLASTKNLSCGVDVLFFVSISLESAIKYDKIWEIMFPLCEPSGYVYNWKIYTGRSDPMAGLGLNETVVMELMQPSVRQRVRLIYRHFLYKLSPG